MRVGTKELYVGMLVVMSVWAIISGRWDIVCVLMAIGMVLQWAIAHDTHTEKTLEASIANLHNLFKLHSDRLDTHSASYDNHDKQLELLLKMSNGLDDRLTKLNDKVALNKLGGR